MLETCGDVIALDHCEPKLSESFTDRVLAGRREQLDRVRSHRRTRMVFYAGSSLAAAAGIALIFFIFTPWSNQGRETVIDSKMESAPVVVQEIMRGLSGDKEVTPQVRAELAATEEMPLPVFSEALAKLLTKTQNTLENTRQSFKDLELLFYLAIPDTTANEKIIEEYRALNQSELSDNTSVNQGADEGDLGNPSSPNHGPSVHRRRCRLWTCTYGRVRETRRGPDARYG